MGDLSRESNVSVASIKFYLREGLLMAGKRTAPNQAAYDESHLRRLRLIRALRDVGGLSIASIRQAIEAVEAPSEGGLWHTIGCVTDALGETRRAEAVPSPARDRAGEDIDGFLDAHGIGHRPDSTAREALVTALLAFRDSDPAFPAVVFTPYVRELSRLAAWEVTISAPTPAHLRETVEQNQPAAAAADPAEILEGLVYGTMLFEPVILALRRLLHESFATSGVQATDLPEWAAAGEAIPRAALRPD